MKHSKCTLSICLLLFIFILSSISCYQASASVRVSAKEKPKSTTSEATPQETTKPNDAEKKPDEKTPSDDDQSSCCERIIAIEIPADSPVGEKVIKPLSEAHKMAFLQYSFFQKVLDEANKLIDADIAKLQKISCPTTDLSCDALVSATRFYKVIQNSVKGDFYKIKGQLYEVQKLTVTFVTVTAVIPDEVTKNNLDALISSSKELQEAYASINEQIMSFVPYLGQYALTAVKKATKEMDLEKQMAPIIAEWQKHIDKASALPLPKATTVSAIQEKKSE